jgi:hypothetical protein
MVQVANAWAQKGQKKQEQKSEAEEHGKLQHPAYGRRQYWDILLIPYRLHLLHLRVRHRIAASESHTDPPSPVIIAENMIGCAMYELVCGTKLSWDERLLTALGPCWS